MRENQTSSRDIGIGTLTQFYLWIPVALSKMHFSRVALWTNIVRIFSVVV